MCNKCYVANIIQKPNAATMLQLRLEVIEVKKSITYAICFTIAIKPK